MICFIGKSLKNFLKKFHTWKKIVWFFFFFLMFSLNLEQNNLSCFGGIVHLHNLKVIMNIFVCNTVPTISANSYGIRFNSESMSFGSIWNLFLSGSLFLLVCFTHVRADISIFPLSTPLFYDSFILGEMSYIF